MSVQRWTWNQVGEAGPKAAIYILYADHARIVAEAQARWVEIARQDRMAAHQRGAQEAERQHAKALAEMEQAHAAALAEASGRFGGERPADLIHDGEATPLDNMGLRDRDEVENRLSSIRSLMLARPPRTTADALRALADDIQGAAIDGEATPQVKPCSTCGEPVAYLTARPGWAGGWLHHPARPLDGHPAAIDGEAGR